MTKDDVLKLLAEACATAGSQAKWAKAHKLSQAYVNDVARGRREPGDAILQVLGLEKVVTYREVNR